MKTTPTQRANKFRASMRIQGAMRFEVTLSAETLATIKTLAKQRGVRRWEVIEAAIQCLIRSDAGIKLE